MKKEKIRDAAPEPTYRIQPPPPPPEPNLNIFKMIDGEIFLDDTKLLGIDKYTIKRTTNKNIKTLFIKMDIKV